MPRSLGESAAETLRDIGLFGGLSDETLRAFGGALTVIDQETDAVVYREGETGRDMFVVLTGELSMIRLSKRQHEITVAFFKPGSWFGEMSILDILPRSATVKASEPSTLLRVTAHDLDTLYRRDLKSYTLVVLNIAREMSRQRRVSEGLLMELMANTMDEYLLRR